MKIGEKTLRTGGEIITNAMLSYITKINEAFNNNGEDDLKIGLSLTIKPGPASGNFKLKASIDFVTQKIKDTFSGSVDEVQADLFGPRDDMVGCPREKGPVNKSICNKCLDRATTLKVDDLEIGWMSCRAWADSDHRVFWEKILVDHDARLAAA